MPQPIRFVLALHNHQPIGNFDGVIEQAYQESYRPFLDVLDRYPHLPLALHTSGSPDGMAATTIIRSISTAWPCSWRPVVWRSSAARSMSRSCR